MSAAAHRCPQCSAPTTWEGNPFRPFCSERCQLVDLSHWFDERYRVPGSTPDEHPASSSQGNETDEEY